MLALRKPVRRCCHGRCLAQSPPRPLDRAAGTRKNHEMPLSAILSGPLPGNALCALLLAVVVAIIWLNLCDRDDCARMTPAERKDEDETRWLDPW
jgi:hypothetical protein